MDAVEVPQAVLKHTEPHGALHHVHALQLEVVHRVQGGHAARVRLGQAQQLLRRRGDGLAGRFGPESPRSVNNCHYHYSITKYGDTILSP